MITLPKLTIGGIILVSTAALILLFAGCGDNPVKPVVQDNGGTALGFYESHVNGPLAKGGDWILATAHDTANVGKAGGTLTLNLACQTSTLTIPSDAVCSGGGTCVVSITAAAMKVATPYGSLFLYDFGPDGQQFAKPCNLNILAGFPSGKTVSLYWLDPVTNIWVLLQQVEVGKQGEVKFSINHFSKYGIS